MRPGTSRRSALAIWVLILCLTVWAPRALAQRPTGTLVGTVFDASGAVVPGAKVTLINEATNVKRTFVTDDSGAFRFPSLDPGSYRLAAEQTGFRQAIAKGVSLGVDESRRVDLTLQVGPVEEQVVVEAVALRTETDTADVSATLTGAQMRDLPIITRNFVEYVALVPGVTPSFGSSSDWVQGWVSPGSKGEFASDSSVTGVNIGGGRVSHNSFTVDGISNTNTAYGTSGVTPSVDAIQEVKVETSYYSAESKGSSLVNVSIKSGSNSLHGTLFEFVRHAALQPTDPRTSHPVTDQPYKPPFQYHNYGGTFGGPIRIPGLYDGKDRSFFFVSYEGLYFRNTSITEARLIDPAWRTGDFSDFRDASGNLILIYDPATSPRTPFPGNVIPANRIAPQTAKYLDLFVPDQPGGLQILSLTNAYDVGNLTLKLDHNFSENDRLTGRFNMQTTDNVEPQLTRYSGSVLNVPAKSIALLYTHIFSPRVVNELRLGYNRTLLDFRLETTGGSEDYAKEVGFANTSPDPMDFGVPRIFFRVLKSFGPSASVEVNTTNTYQYYDVLSWSRGRQNWKFGVDIRRDLDRVSKSDGWGRGGLRFYNGYTAASSSAPVSDGHSFADFLLGLASYARISPVPRRYHPRVWDSAFFVQTDWAVTRYLTLNLGLRYEYGTWPGDLEPGGDELDATYAGGRLLSPNQDFVNTVNNPIFAFGSRPGVIKADRNDWAPRIGLAWRPFKTDNTVVRAGYGLFYVKSNDWYTWERSRPQELLSAPNPISVGRSSPGVDIRTLFPASVVPGASVPYWARWTLEPNSRHPYSQQWSLGIQHMIMKNLFLDARYQGKTGTKLPIYVLFNQAFLDPDPNNPTDPQTRVPYANFTPYSSFVCYCTSSNYNALQLQLERRLAQGLGFTVAYTWSKSIDVGSEIQASGATSNIPNQSHNLEAERGISNFDVPHRLAITYMYELPFGQGRRWMKRSGWVNQVVGGWSTMGLVTFMSGRAWTPIVGWDDSYTGIDTYGDAVRAQIVGDPFPSGFKQSLTQWVDPNAFAEPAFGTFGNAGRNILRGVDTRKWDMSILKDLKIGERATLQFRASWFNVTGRFGNGAIPNPYVWWTGPGGFGAIVEDPADIWASAEKQLAIRLTF